MPNSCKYYHLVCLWTSQLPLKNHQLESEPNLPGPPSIKIEKCRKKTNDYNVKKIHFNNKPKFVWKMIWSTVYPHT